MADWRDDEDEEKLTVPVLTFETLSVSVERVVLEIEEDGDTLGLDVIELLPDKENVQEDVPPMCETVTMPVAVILTLLRDDKEFDSNGVLLALPD